MNDSDPQDVKNPGRRSGDILLSVMVIVLGYLRDLFPVYLAHGVAHYSFKTLDYNVYV